MNGTMTGIEHMSNIIGDAKAASPIMKTANGVPVYDTNDYTAMSKARLMERRAMGRKTNPEAGTRQMTPDGLGYTSSRARAVAIDPNTYFVNRVVIETEDFPSPTKSEPERIVSLKRYCVVTDYRAIKEQDSGNVYTNNIVVHVIGKVNPRSNKLSLLSTKSIGVDDFVNKYREQLSHSDMKTILGIIGQHEIKAVPEVSLEI